MVLISLPPNCWVDIWENVKLLKIKTAKLIKANFNIFTFFNLIYLNYDSVNDKYI